MASTISQNSWEEIKRRYKPSSSPWSFPFQNDVGCTTQLHNPGNRKPGMGPVLSSLPSTPCPKKVSSPSLKTVDPGPDRSRLLGIIRGSVLTRSRSDLPTLFLCLDPPHHVIIKQSERPAANSCIANQIQMSHNLVCCCGTGNNSDTLRCVGLNVSYETNQ